MNEFAINWIKGADYAEITVPNGTALKSKLLKLAEEKPEEVNHVIINKDGSIQTTISVLQIMSTEARLIWKNARKDIHIAQGIVSTIRRIRKRELRKGKNIGTWSKRTESDQICC